MLVREYKPSDLEVVRSLHERSFPFPDLDDRHYVIKEIAEENGKIVGFGAVRLTSEALVILDEKQRKRTKAEAIEWLLCEAVLKCQRFNIDEITTFLTGCDSERFALALEKRAGFVRCKGLPMTLLLGR